MYENPSESSVSLSQSASDVDATFSSVCAPQRFFGLGWWYQLRRDPLQALNELMKLGDAVQINLMGQRMHCLFHPMLVRAAFMEDERSFFKEGRQLNVFGLTQGASVLSTVGADWARQRSLLGPAFRPRQMTLYASRILGAAIDTQNRYMPGASGACLTIDPAAYASEVTMGAMCRVLFSQAITPTQARRQASVAVRALGEHGQRMLMWPFIPP